MLAVIDLGEPGEIRTLQFVPAAALVTKLLGSIIIELAPFAQGEQSRCHNDKSSRSQSSAIIGALDPQNNERPIRRLWLWALNGLPAVSERGH